MNHYSKQPKAVARGSFKTTDKPVQYKFVLHQDNHYRPRHRASTEQTTTPTAQRTHTSRYWLIGGLLVLAIIFWHLIWIILQFCFVAFLECLPWLIVIVIAHFIKRLIGDGGGSGYGDSWDDGYNAGFDDYNLMHGDDHDGNNDSWY